MVAPGQLALEPSSTHVEVDEAGTQEGELQLPCPEALTSPSARTALPEASHTLQLTSLGVSDDVLLWGPSPHQVLKATESSRLSL